MAEQEREHRARGEHGHTARTDGSAAQEPSNDEHAEPASSQEEVAQLQRDLDAARRRVDELARALLAGERDREDFKKRMQRERERLIDVEKGNVAQVLLETIDELDLCVGSADESALAKGVRMIRDGLLARLSSLGVERVALQGAPFDPNLAEAVDMEVTSDPQADQTVVQELRPAYKLGERLIRAGRVKVARYFPPMQA